jgi:hypothetical protein
MCLPQCTRMPAECCMRMCMHSVTSALQYYLCLPHCINPRAACVHVHACCAAELPPRLCSTICACLNALSRVLRAACMCACMLCCRAVNSALRYYMCFPQRINPRAVCVHVHACCAADLSPRLWSLWPQLHALVMDFGIDYWENILIPLDNFISR